MKKSKGEEELGRGRLLGGVGREPPQGLPVAD